MLVYGHSLFEVIARGLACLIRWVESIYLVSLDYRILNKNVLFVGLLILLLLGSSSANALCQARGVSKGNLLLDLTAVSPEPQPLWSTARPDAGNFVVTTSGKVVFFDYREFSRLKQLFQWQPWPFYARCILFDPLTNQHRIISMKVSQRKEVLFFDEEEVDKNSLEELQVSKDWQTILKQKLPNYCTVTVLSNRKFLVSGGQNRITPLIFPHCRYSIGSDWCGIFDCQTGSFERDFLVEKGKLNHSAIKLKNGKVLLVGGSFTQGSKQLLLVDSDNGKGKVLCCSLIQGRRDAGLALTREGKVLIVGGSDSDPVEREQTFCTIEEFDPITETIRVVGKMEKSRFFSTGTQKERCKTISRVAVVLPDGRLLVSGGAYSNRIKPGALRDENFDYGLRKSAEIIQLAP